MSLRDTRWVGVGSLTSVAVAADSSSLDIVSTSTVPGLSSVASAIGVGEKRFRINDVDGIVEPTGEGTNTYSFPTTRPTKGQRPIFNRQGTCIHRYTDTYCQSL